MVVIVCEGPTQLDQFQVFTPPLCVSVIIAHLITGLKEDDWEKGLKEDGYNKHSMINYQKAPVPMLLFPYRVSVLSSPT